MELTNCKGCLKNFMCTSILKHLDKKKESCMKIYTAAELSELREEAKKRNKKKEKSWKAKNMDQVLAQNSEYRKRKSKSNNKPKSAEKTDDCSEKPQEESSFYTFQEALNQVKEDKVHEIDWNFRVQCRICQKTFKSNGILNHVSSNLACYYKISEDERDQLRLRNVKITKEKKSVWLEENKSKVAYQKKEWYERNKAMIAQDKKAHRDFHAFKSSVYHEKNKNKISKRKAEYYKLNKEKLLEKKKQRQIEANANPLLTKKRNELMSKIQQFKSDVIRNKVKDMESLNEHASLQNIDIITKYQNDIERFKKNSPSEQFTKTIEQLEEDLNLDLKETRKELKLEAHFVSNEVEAIIGLFLEEFGQELYSHTKSVKPECFENIDFKMAEAADRKFRFDIQNNLRQFIRKERILIQQHWRKELVPLATEFGENDYGDRFYEYYCGFLWDDYKEICEEIYNSQKSVTELRRENERNYLENKEKIRQTHFEAINLAKKSGKSNWKLK